jgi:photosystem II stability/assembly factor-like uncharacterized protein
MYYRRGPIGLALCCFLLATVVQGSEQSAFQDVLDTPAQMSKLAAHTLLNGVAVAGKRLIGVGQSGHIVYSDDQGKNWKQAAVPVSSDLLAVHFPSEKNGWAVGHDGVVLHTADGGTTWTKQFEGRAAAQVMMSYYKDPQQCRLDNVERSSVSDQELQRYVDQGPDKPFLDVWFENDTTGYVVGAFNLIFRTTDGGKSWTPLFERVDNPKRYHLYAIKPIGSDLFVTGEQGSLYKLDGRSGRFKTIKTPYSGTFFGITGRPGAVILFGMRGNAFRSSDGGASWKKVETGVSAGLTGAMVLEDGRFVLVSQIGHVLVSSDDGKSFDQVKIERPFAAAAVTALDRDTLVVAGHRGANIVSTK